MIKTTIEKRDTTSNVPKRIEQGMYFTPLVDIIDSKDEFVFKADLPGVKPSDLDVSFENGILSISAKVQSRQPEDLNYLWQEFGVGNFHREFTINAPINVDGIRAELKNGELMLNVPKAEQAKSRKILIKGS